MNSYYDGPLVWNGHGCNVKTAVIVDYLGPTDHKGSRWRAKVKNSNERAWTASVGFQAGPIEAAAKLLKKYKLDWELQHGASTNNGDTYIFTIKWNYQ